MIRAKKAAVAKATPAIVKRLLNQCLVRGSAQTLQQAVERVVAVEVQHQLYNYEITGIGKLRFDRGDTSLNPEEVEYLRLVSGGQGQQLMDAVMMP